jgi:lysophospholipase L1-like esterase
MKTGWLATWTAAPMNVWAPDAPLSGFYNQTVREIARVSIGGERIALRLTNDYGSDPIVLGAVRVAGAGESGRTEPLTTRPVLFGGRAGAVIHPGTSLISDPVDFPTAPLSRLAVSIFSSGFVPVHTHHFEAQQPAYVSVPGDFSAAEQMIVERVTTSHYLLSAIYTETEASARAIVCFGDSITDGYGSTDYRDNRWPDVLAERLQQERGGGQIAVLNQGIGGNRLLHGGRGQSARSRFDRDVLGFPRVSHVIILRGINDIVWPGTALAGSNESVSAGDIIDAYKQLITRARLHGLDVLLGTLGPFEGALPDFPKGGYYTPQKERLRQAVNEWIRCGESGVGVVDFDRVLRDPHRPSRLHEAFDSGDHIHPNDRGYRAMAEAVDIASLIQTELVIDNRST